jgi:hypothetical protein
LFIVAVIADAAVGVADPANAAVGVPEDANDVPGDANAGATGGDDVITGSVLLSTG